MMVSCILLWDQACSETMSNNRVSVERFQRDVFFSKTEAIYRYNYILKISISIYKIGQLSKFLGLITQIVSISIYKIGQLS